LQRKRALLGDRGGGKDAVSGTQAPAWFRRPEHEPDQSSSRHNFNHLNQQRLRPFDQANNRNRQSIADQTLQSMESNSSA
tara:strand:- start:261 stop:500 length:240 start_codon:yes stop_codon:yes gene_type:complete